MSGSRFTVLDAGHSVSVRKSPPDVVSSQCELASIHYVRDALVSTIFTIFYRATLRTKRANCTTVTSVRPLYVCPAYSM